MLAALGIDVEMPVVLAVFAGSLLIDLDHLPGLLGSGALQQGTPRPYTHSLLTVSVMLVAAFLVSRRRRKIVIAAAVALVLHFFRDMAEPGGSGVALLWPVSDRGYVIGYVWYAAGLALLVTVAIAGRTSVPHIRGGSSRGDGRF